VLALTVVVVFAAMWVFDTAALVRLTVFCVSGRCGVPSMWIAIGAGAIVLAILVAVRRPRADLKKPAVSRPRADVKKPRVTKAGASRPARPSQGKAAASRKPKQAK
jgi:hypothetical protein